MDNLRATLEAAIPATPPTTPREQESNTENNNLSPGNVKPSTAAWLKIKESLPLLEPTNVSDTIFNGISQIEATVNSLSESIGIYFIFCFILSILLFIYNYLGAPRPLSSPKVKYVLERLFRLTDTKDPVLLMRVCKLVYLVRIFSFLLLVLIHSR